MWHELFKERIRTEQIYRNRNGDKWGRTGVGAPLLKIRGMRRHDDPQECVHDRLCVCEDLCVWDMHVHVTKKWLCLCRRLKIGSRHALRAKQENKEEIKKTLCCAFLGLFSNIVHYMAKSIQTVLYTHSFRLLQGICFYWSVLFYWEEVITKV